MQKHPIYAKVEKVKSAFEIIIYETTAGYEPFNDWLSSLDGSVRPKVQVRIDRLEAYGHTGKAKALKDGIYELKFKNPGFRIYYAVIGRQILLLITGGSKSKQTDDIKKAKEYFEDYRSRYGSKKS